METLEPSSRMISNHIKLLENQLKDLKKEPTLSLKKQKIKAFKSELDALRSELNMFELDLCNATEKQREIYFVNFNNCDSQANTFEKEIKIIEDTLSNRPDRAELQLFDDATVKRNEEPQIEQMSRNQLKDHVARNLEEAHGDLDIIMQDLLQGKSIMEEVTLEIKLQTEKLNKAREDIKETYSLTKRTKKLVTYFRRQIMTDKIICVFTILIICAIIVIIVMKAVGFKSDTFNSNVIPNTNTSINMNNNTKSA